MFDKNNPPYGIVGYSNAKGWFGTMQHIFAGPGASHAYVIDYPAGKVSVVPMIFEADMTVTDTPYAKYLNGGTNRDYWLFTMPEFTDAEIVHSLDKCKLEFSGVRYGFLQILWFPYRWFMWNVFHKDVRKTKNWFTDGVICTELWWYFVWYASELFPERHAKIRVILEQWNPDTIQAYDVKMIMTLNPDIFKPFAKYEKGIYTQIAEV